MLYIFWILHQTTTDPYHHQKHTGLYIFWILHQTTTILWAQLLALRCISFESYIKPQLFRCAVLFVSVVYLLNPTSNHNCIPSLVGICTLYIFWILHQTTTYRWSLSRLPGCISFESYIKPQRFPFKDKAGWVVYLLNPTSNHNQT